MRPNEDAQGPSTAPAATPARLFGTFAFISAVTVGGGYAIVPVIESALTRKGWMTEDEFQRLFARAQSFPGPFALNTALLCGRRLAGTRGAAAATAGMVLPPFASLVVVGAILGSVGGYAPVRNFLAGAGATVPGLIAAMIWKMSRKRKWTPARAVGAVGMTVLLAALPALTLPIFFAGIAIMYVAERSWRS